MEIVKVYKYLGIWMQSDNGYKTHINSMKKKVRLAMGAIWGEVL